MSNLRFHLFSQLTRTSQLTAQGIFARFASTSSSENSKLDSTQTNRIRKDRVFLNEVRLIGRVGAEPSLRGANQAFPVAVFPMVTNAFWTTNDGVEHERKDWHRIVCGLPSLRDRIMNTVTKGDRVMVLGSIQYRETVDNQGVKHNNTFISAARVLNLSNKKLNAIAEADAEAEADDQYNVDNIDVQESAKQKS